MNREELKALGLTDEQVESVMKSHGKATNDLKEKADSVEGLESQINDYKGQIKERDEQLNVLSEKVKDNEELASQVNEWKEKNDITATEYKEKLDKQAKDFAIETALREAKAKNPKLAKGALDLESITYKDGKLIGIEEQLTAVKESDAYLFGEDVPAGLQGRQPHPGGDNNPPSNKNPFSKDHFNLTEQGKLVRENPDEAKQLISQAGGNPANYGL